MLVYQSNEIIGQTTICESDNFDVCWALFWAASKQNDKGQTCYLIIGGSNEKGL